MSQDTLFEITEYQKLYKKSIEDPEQFWTEVGQQFFWKTQPKSVLNGNLDITKGSIFVEFMGGAQTNACFNVLDRNIERGLGDNIVYHWEGNDGKSKRRITYTELRREVCKFANALKGLHIKKGDRIAIYMPVSIECVVAMLACARIGAVHSVMFAGFAAESLANRIIDGKCVLIISSDGCYRENKLIPLKHLVDSALDICSERGYQKISNIVYKHLNCNSDENDCKNNNNVFSWNDQVDISWDNIVKDQDNFCVPAWLSPNDPLFTLYTSGTTGKPKGIVHSCGGYPLYAYYFSKQVFNLKPGEVHFLTSDLGWATSHFCTVYGGLATGATMVLMEGTPTFPNTDRLWEIVDRLQVNVFNTAPTVLRMLLKSGDHYVKAYKRDSLRLLATSGESANSEAWLWYWNIVGDRRCPILDLYGQTETGGTMIANLPCSSPTKASATLPFFGIVPAVLNDEGIEIIGPGNGHLVYKALWPGMALTIEGNHDLFESTYFQKFPGYYCTGDGVRRDAEGYYWIGGRTDDTFNVSGHLLSAKEIEMTVLEHKAVVEAAVVPAPDSVKGEVPIVFVVLHNGYAMNPELEKGIKNLGRSYKFTELYFNKIYHDQVRENMGAFAQPKQVISVYGLPKNKSGKIVRRILQKIIRNDSNFGDTSTLEDQSVLNELKEIKKNFNQTLI